MEPTKRQVVSLVSRFYDPLGILSPVIVPFKIFFHELSKLKQGWDQYLSGETLTRWKILLKGLKTDGPIVIPRCYSVALPEESLSSTYRLWCFCDASAQAYAAVVYLVITTNTTAATTLVCSKTRIAPRQKLTIPRLELMSAVLLARLINSVSEALSSEVALHKPYCYTDSKISYHWICGSEKGWQPFVQNRVNTIRKLMPASQWRHYPGSDNPADIPSRGLTLSELRTNALWIHGPEWLQTTDYEEDPTLTEIPDECLTEMKRNAVHTLLKTQQNGISRLINADNYSDIDRLLRVTAYVLFFVQKLKGVNPSFSELTVESESLWVIEVQTSFKGDG